MKTRFNRSRYGAVAVSLLALLGAPLVLSSLAPPAQAQSGSAKKPTATERKRIVEALRVPVAKKLKQPVIFEINRIKTQNGWAFLTGTPRKPNGKPINYAKTSYAEQERLGMFDDGFCALLRRQNGKWKVKTYNIGATDVQWANWDKEYGAPSGLFK